MSHDSKTTPIETANGSPEGRSWKILMLPGDGIGPEIMKVADELLQKIAKGHGIPIECTWAAIGGAAIDLHGDPLPESTLELARAADAVLLGAVGDPRHAKAARAPEAALLQIRQALGLYANLRPTRVVRPDLGPLRPQLAEGVDLIIVRELTGGIYFGQPRLRERDAQGMRAVDTMVYTEAEVERVARLAFELASARRGRVCSVDKANVLDTSRLWREVVESVARDFPKVELRHLLVDAATIELIRAPREFDVLLTGNLFGDILSDEVSVVAGSIGLGPSASLGAPATQGLRPGLYEPIHGSAPDLAGKGLANPIGMLGSVAMMLRNSLGAETAATRLEAALDRVQREGPWTADLTRPGVAPVGTAEVAAAISALLD